MAVNISIRNLEDPNFPTLVERALAAKSVDPSHLVIEITENTTALDSATVRAGLQQLSDLGTGLSIDDFGTGYSSIIQLRNLPVNQIKLDRQFVGNMADDSRNALIVRAILQLADALDVETVAEGVEEELVAALLRDLGCDHAQGFLFAVPMSAQDVGSWLHRRGRWKLPIDLRPGGGYEAAPSILPPP
jgi:EAL domain-containing protein (putative c-di-GMP-specific phosphodiesterase class I)